MAHRRRAKVILPFDVPEWVPDGIKEVALIRYDFLSNPVSPYRPIHGVALLKRLVTAPRMKNVWDELTKKHRVGRKSHGGFFHSTPLPKSLDGKMTERDRHLIGIEILFQDVFAHASLCIPGGAGTPAQGIAQKRDAFLEARKTLHSDAWFLRSVAKVKNRTANRLYFAKLSKHLDKAAVGYGAAAALLNAHYLNDDEIIAIWFSTKTAKRMLELFGSPMYGTVATIATVVLQRNITHSNVREWCSGPLGIRRPWPDLP
jgi:hypothetical protein